MKIKKKHRTLAELCGFGSIHHFSNAYKQHFGISPASHREKHTKK